MWKNCVANVGSVVSRNVASIVRFDTSLVSANDYDFWVRVYKKCNNTITFDGPGIIHRRFGTPGITNSRRKKINGRVHFYLKHRKMMRPLQRLNHLCMTMLKIVIPDVRYVYSTVTRILHVK